MRFPEIHSNELIVVIKVNSLFMTFNSTISSDSNVIENLNLNSAQKYETLIEFSIRDRNNRLSKFIPHHSLIRHCVFHISIEKHNFYSLSISRKLFPGAIWKDNKSASIWKHLLNLKHTNSLQFESRLDHLQCNHFNSFLIRSPVLFKVTFHTTSV